MGRPDLVKFPTVGNWNLSVSLTTQRQFSFDSDHTDDEYESDEPNERTSLLPPSGISTNERDGKESYTGDSYRRSRRAKGNASSSSRHRQLVPPEEHSTRRWDNRASSEMLEQATKVSLKLK